LLYCFKNANRKINYKRKTSTTKSISSQGKSGGGGDLRTAIQIASLFSGGGFAQGGTVSKGQPIVVGERGAELFVPNQHRTNYSIC
jgi:hypothetical protein